MKKTNLIKKCAEYLPDWESYEEGICPPDGLGIFRFKDIENDFKGKSQMGEYWGKTYLDALLNSVIHQVNIDYSNFLSDLNFVIHYNGIVIFDRDNSVIAVVDNPSGVCCADKEKILIKYFEFIGADREAES